MDELEMLKHMEEAMTNSFDIIVGNTSMEELMITRGIEDLMFAHNIETGPTPSDIVFIRDYFIEKEDYERCAELSKML
jgi:hypothetical protein